MTTTKRTWRRRAIALAATTAVMLGASILTSPAAQAHDGSILCTLGTAHQEFTPPLNVLPHAAAVHEDGHLTGCSSSNHPKIVAADYTYEGQGQLSCSTGGNTTGTFTFHWLDSKGHPEGTTIVDFTDVAVIVRPDGQQVSVAVGDTTGGTHFHPSHVVYDEVLLTNPLDCLLGGVEEQDGVNVGMLIS